MQRQDSGANEIGAYRAYARLRQFDDSRPDQLRPNVHGSNRSDGQVESLARYHTMHVTSSAPPAAPQEPVLKRRNLADMLMLSAQEQYDLGQRHLNGIEVVRDHKQAFIYFGLAAAGNLTAAQFSLGVMFESGLGMCEPDPDKAAHWFGKAAWNGHEEAGKRLRANGWSRTTLPETRSALAALAGGSAAPGKPAAVSASAWLQGLLEKKPQELYDHGQQHYKNAGAPGRYGLAFPYFCLAAYKNSANAQSSLAEMYEFGYGVHVDQESSILWARKAAQQGNRDAILKIAYRYEEGNGLPRNRDMAEQWHAWAEYGAPEGTASAAKTPQADADILRILGEYFLAGRFVPRDFGKFLACREVADRSKLAEMPNSPASSQVVEAEWPEVLAPPRNERRLNERATRGTLNVESTTPAPADQDNATARFKRLTLSGTGLDSGRAQEWLDYLARQRDEQAQEKNVQLTPRYIESKKVVPTSKPDALVQFRLGQLHEKGDGLAPPNQYKAFECYAEAAALGHADAQFKLGESYRLGTGISLDRVKAFEWYSKAAAQGHPAAQCNLGTCYANGHGVLQDDRKAADCYLKSALQGDAMGQVKLGNCYDHGSGVIQDAAEAAVWYRKAAQQGNDLAQYCLGFSYASGGTGSVDEQSAFEWWSKAAQQGFAQAQTKLGHCYEHGIGVGQDRGKATEWYWRAAVQGHAPAQFSVGMGFSLAGNWGNASSWFTKAADQGLAAAELQLGFCYANGLGVEENMSIALKWYELAVAHGDIQAHFYLADCLCRKIGGHYNVLRAFELMRIAAARKDQKAIEWLQQNAM